MVQEVRQVVGLRWIFTVILEGYFAHHIRRMRQIYAERIAVLVEAARRRLAGRLDVELAASG